MNQGHPSFLSAVDLLVLGAGMAGMSAAAMAASCGRRVVVVEHAETIGGSAVSSGGWVWVYDSLGRHCSAVPECDTEIARALLDHFDDAMAWLASLGADLGTPQEIAAFPGSIGYRIDVPGYIDRCRRVLESGDGVILTGHSVGSLLQAGEAVVGGVLVAPGLPDRELSAAFTLLASGGFHSDPELRERFIGPAGRSLLTNRTGLSDGAGLRLGLSVGADTSEAMHGFYGDLMASPTPAHPPDEYLRFAQSTYTPHGVLLSREGTRFVDESLGYPTATPAVARQTAGRAVVIGDERVRREVASRPLASGTTALDRVGVAEAGGAHVARADDLRRLATALEPWGYPADKVVRTLIEFNESMLEDRKTSPDRRHNRCALTEPPLFAVEVRPQISFTYGGLRIDSSARVLDRSGQPIAGLLAAGVDAAGVHGGGYGGRLAAAVVFALQAMKATSYA